ncbi:unnamed protein product [Allacma fusca]|uniref:G-protein coupled receptors family 1 profile domain-containing protein n=1 Tax=Allacma fusca TaxID=39272 RepID=A0A8J2P961_9HEXA|nr:unnamed protein product [Allacma fusca]
MKPYPGVRRGFPCNPKNNHPLRAARRETSIIRAHRRLRKKLSNPMKPPPPLLPTYSSQSFRSRRRAANLLAALAGVFVFCWAPYVVCALWDMFAKDNKSIVRLLIPFALFLGHAHSAINPVVSWRLNRSAFVRFQRQPILSFLPDWSLLKWCRTCTCPCGCSSCDRLPPTSPHSSNRRPTSPINNGTSEPCGCCRRCCLCCCCTCPSFGHFRRSSSPDGWARNSSTNEAALGAFHPKYLSRLPVPDPISKCHTSHFLK